MVNVNYSFLLKILKFLIFQLIIIYCLIYKNVFFNKEIYSKKINIIKTNYNNTSTDYSFTNYINISTNLTEFFNDINTIKIFIKQKKYDIYINPYFEKETQFYELFLSLKKLPNECDNTTLELIKDELNKKIKDDYDVDFSTIDEVCFDSSFRFGNQLAVFNKFLFYCEIIGIKKLYIPIDNNIYIKSNIYDEKYDLRIEIYDNNTNGELCGQYSYIAYLPNFFYDFYIYRVENRFGVFKEEILRNLPSVEIDQNDLYIHFRGDDVFTKSFNDPEHAPAYAPYPLCFYKKIIEKNNFKKIYLISEDRLNPIIDILLNNYTNTIYNKN